MARELNLKLPPAADIFAKLEEQDAEQIERIEEIPLSLIDTFEDHPFNVRMDAITLETIESVKRLGRVHTPTLVRPKSDGRYELISGHRRRLASETAGLETLPCIVRAMDRDTAIIVMRECNIQRENPLPSEKARAYKMWLGALERQLGRPSKENVSPVATHFPKGKRSADVVGEPYEDKKDSVYRFIALNDLIPELLQMVDDWHLQTKGKPQIAMRPAVDISNLPKDMQQCILLFAEMQECTPSHAQTQKMLRFQKDGQLNEGVILSIMQEEKPNQVEKIKIPHDKISRFFPDDTPAERITATIVEALELRQRKLERDRKRKLQEQGDR